MQRGSRVITLQGAIEKSNIAIAILKRKTSGNHQKPPERLNGKGASDGPNIYELNRRIYTHYTHCLIH
jgi:hypothetical protein